MNSSDIFDALLQSLARENGQSLARLCKSLQQSQSAVRRALTLAISDGDTRLRIDEDSTPVRLWLNSASAALEAVGSQRFSVQRWRGKTLTTEDDLLVQECAVAVEVNGISVAVMMVTPIHLDWFAIGFLYSEAVLHNIAELISIDIETQAQATVVQVQVSANCLARLKAQRRRFSGVSGCGLCGVDSLAAALPELRPIARVAHSTVMQLGIAMRMLADQQTLNRATGAVHAAAWLDVDGKLMQTFEDVGRHNALDKLIGHLLLLDKLALTDTVLVSSRASIELVQKTVRAGIPQLATVSAATAQAVELARQQGLSLFGFVRGTDAVHYSNANS